MWMSPREARDHVLNLVREVKNNHKLPGRPSIGDVVAALELPPVCHTALPNNKDGMHQDRQIVLNEQNKGKSRDIFTFFHEVLHILIEEDGEIIALLHDACYRADNQDRADAEMHQALEDLCNFGAAEFVLPAHEFTPFLKEERWQVTAIERAALAFRSSMLAAAFQFAYQNPDPCTMVVCEWGTLSNNDHPQLDLHPQTSTAGLHVAYTACHQNSYPMCRHVGIPQKHLLHHVWEEGVLVEDKAPGFFRTPRDWSIVCHAARMGERVYAAYYPKDRRYNAEQITLFDEW